MSKEFQCRQTRRSVSDSDYCIDDGGILAYWDSLNNRYGLLLPGSIIHDPHVCIGKVGQQNLLTTHMTLKAKDLEWTRIADEKGNIIDDVPPGVSTFLFWGSQLSKQDDLKALSESCLGREPSRKNRIYVAQVGDIQEAGWSVFFAPLIDRNYTIYNPLHTVITPNSLLNKGELKDAEEDEKERLIKAFIRWP